MRDVMDQSKFCVRSLLVAGAIAFSAAISAADAPPVTAQTLIDRAMIEDLLVDYYAQLGSSNEDFGAWYVEDGILDVNGQVGKGKAGIAGIYRDTAARTTRKGTFRMVLSNTKIVVKGDTATADMIWTGLNSETVTSPTTVEEQGREHDDLVKRNGKWLFKHRVITSDGGMPKELLKTYKKR